MLKQYKKDYRNKSVQFVLTDDNGMVLESDQQVLKAAIGAPIFELHPFFYCISSVMDSVKKEISYNCIHLSYGNQEIIADIELIKKKEGILIIISDLTQHYISYQNMAQSRNESIIDSELVVLRNMELKEREKFKDRFIRNFSHELRNPLTNIVSLTNVLDKTNLTKEQKKVLHILKDANTNLKLMLEDILSISMISVGKLSLKPTVSNFFSFFDLLEFTYKAKAKEKNLDFILDLDKGIPEFIEVDRLRLFQVLTNLLDNAFKYTDEGNVSMHVKLNQKRAHKASLHFEISDSGKGIKKEHLETVFESFSRMDTEEKRKGAGLGLSIVKGILELMGSKIMVKSILGKGSTFYFDLTVKYPLRPTGNAGSKQNTKHIGVRKNPKNDRRYKILMVEDDERAQTALFRTLMDANSFYIDLASDGSKVLEEIISNQYDLVLMDINLPNVTGDQITRIIRDFPLHRIKNIPILGITAYAFEDNIKDYLNSGMNAVISKPYEETFLLETIFKLLK
ncbi:MAG: ATP-binding protein [Bacteroidota bacterium]